jgi:maltose O-acetyltransferase
MQKSSRIDMLKSFLRSVVGGLRLAKLKLRNRDFHVGRHFYCAAGCRTSPGRSIIIGDNFYMGYFCHLAAPAVIGNDVLFASTVALVGGDHRFDGIDIPIRLSGRDEMKLITIGDNVWIGHGVIVMHGVTIGAGAVVASGAVITKDIPENAIFGGNPARLIRYRHLPNVTGAAAG